MTYPPQQPGQPWNPYGQQGGNYGQPGNYGGYGYPPPGRPGGTNSRVIIIIVVIAVAIIGGGIGLAVALSGSNSQQSASGSVSSEAQSAFYILQQALSSKDSFTLQSITCSADKNKVDALTRNAPAFSSGAKITTKVVSGNKDSLTYHADGTINGTSVNQDITVKLVSENGSSLLCNLSKDSFPGGNLSTGTSSTGGTAVPPTGGSGTTADPAAKTAAQNFIDALSTGDHDALLSVVCDQAKTGYQQSFSNPNSLVGPNAQITATLVSVTTSGSSGRMIYYVQGTVNNKSIGQQSGNLNLQNQGGQWFVCPSVSQSTPTS